ncbi:MAG: FecR domain-containing protein, partial [Dehalococcoidia bacterium]
MKNDLSKILDECVAWIREGEEVEACLARYPYVRQQLEPLLQTALSVFAAPKEVPSDEFRRVSKARLMSRLRQNPIQATERSGGILGALANAIVPLRRAALPVSSVLLVSLIGLLVAYLVSDFLPGNTALASQSTLSVLSGTAEVQLPGSDIWQRAENGMIVDAGSRVKTSEASRALLTFFEGSTIELEPNTEVVVERIERVEEQRFEIVLRQWLGKTWSRVVEKADPGSRYEIRTPSAYALVRGTLFEVEVDETGFTVVRTIEGLVSVGAQGEEVNVPAGQQVSVETGALPSEPAPIPAADNELVITVGMPAVATVTDPTWSSTGYLPNGLALNQIPGSYSSSPADGDQIIRIPQPMAGVYRIALRGV